MSGTDSRWDPYEELGIGQSASLEEIKWAFRSKARESHPDKVIHDDQGEKFRRVRHAYEVLTDSDARARYDAGKFVEERHNATIIEVDLDDMESSLDDETETYSHTCRCSGSFVITADQLSEGYDTICCSSCSLYIRVLYQPAPD